MGKRKNLKGKVFGRLTVLSFSHTNKNRHSIWDCECCCGNRVKVLTGKLTTGQTKSCGCLQKERASDANSTHRLRHHALYVVWANIKARCLNENSPAFQYYGGRGITLFDPWINNFKLFFDWALENGYKDGLTIERINNDDGYSPSNCTFIPQSEQCNNKRSTRYLTFNGVKMPLYKWAANVNLSAKCLAARLKYGWSVEKALTTQKLK